MKNRIDKNISQNVFCFNEITKAEVLKEISYINNRKTTPFNTIPSKILKIPSECSTDTLKSLVNKSLTSSRNFLLILNRQILHTETLTPTKNYRPVSVLPPLLKVFERFMQTQINSLIMDYLPDFLCGCRQDSSTQHALIK